MLKVLVTVVVGLMIMQMVQSDGILGDQKTVRVENDLASGYAVFLHCKSGDNDLGPRNLAKGEYQEWSFRNNIAHTTRYYCYLQILHGQVSFDVYSYKDDNGRCADKCYRSLRDDGLYFYYQYENKWEKKLSWNIHAF